MSADISRDIRERIRIRAVEGSSPYGPTLLTLHLDIARSEDAAWGSPPMVPIEQLGRSILVVPAGGRDPVARTKAKNIADGRAGHDAV